MKVAHSLPPDPSPQNFENSNFFIWAHRRVLSNRAGAILWSGLLSRTILTISYKYSSAMCLYYLLVRHIFVHESFEDHSKIS
jgi:hypothetical protein